LGDINFTCVFFGFYFAFWVLAKSVPLHRA
jgi:hypothetical protein